MWVGSPQLGFLFCLGPGVFLLVFGLPLELGEKKAKLVLDDNDNNTLNRLLVVSSTPTETASHAAFVGGLSAPSHSFLHPNLLPLSSESGMLSAMLLSHSSDSCGPWEAPPSLSLSGSPGQEGGTL